MKRRIWLIATVAALFGLQVPLCALACLTSPSSESVAADNSGLPPCHKHSPDSTPAEAPNSDTNCCNFAFDAIVVDAGSILNIAFHAEFSRTQAWQLAPSTSLAYAVSTSADLPPPDILLLKSTLII
jgi:hypothetical protein